MDNRKRALAILKEARELLTDRLIENIIESGDGILEDAEACSYMDEIDLLQERIGGRLNSINLMIGNLSAGKPAGEEQESAAEETPASTASPEEANDPKPIDFALFGQQIAANDIDSAGKTLSVLLDVDEKIAHQCATSFRDRLNDDATTIQKAMLLRAKLMAGKNNDSLMILWDCFGLQGLIAVEVLQTLKSRLAAA